MLRPKIFDGLVRRALESRGTGYQLARRREEDAKRVSIAFHVENIRAHYRQLSDDADARGLRGEQKATDFVILLDDTAVSRASRKSQCDSGVHGADGAGLGVVLGDKIALGCRLEMHRGTGGSWYLRLTH